jgi:pimeloyl-ACP methyl ester carboxylesterase
MISLKRLLQTIVGLLLITVILLAIWYQIDGQPLSETDNYLSADNFESSQNENGDWIFTPKSPNGMGIAIIHGALVKAESYAKTAAFFAAQGYKVWMPQGNIRLPLTSADRFATELDGMPENQWFFLGHSMGGFTSLEIHERMKNKQKITGFFIWAGGMVKDFSHLEKPVMVISASNDDILPAERFEKIQSYLPKQTIYKSIEGGNHKNFALYSHQFFDGEATIPHHQQIDMANQITLDFIKTLTHQ